MSLSVLDRLDAVSNFWPITVIITVQQIYRQNDRNSRGKTGGEKHNSRGDHAHIPRRRGPRVSNWKVNDVHAYRLIGDRGGLQYFAAQRPKSRT